MQMRVRANTSLPDGYQELDYVTAAGAQGIVLDYKPAVTDKISIIFAMTNVSVNSCLWCARGATTGTNTLTAFCLSNNIRCDYGTNANTSNGGMVQIGSVAINTIHKLQFDNAKWYLDGVLKHTHTAASYTVGGKIRLFSSYNNGETANVGNYAYLKLYRFEVYNSSGTAKVILIPCIRNSDNKIGLYDKVANKFFYSATTLASGNKTAKKFRVRTLNGTTKYQMNPQRSIALPEAYQRVTYIRSVNGQQFIDTGFVPNYANGFQVSIVYKPSTLAKRYALASTYNTGNSQLSLELNANSKARYWIDNGRIDMVSTNNYTTNINTTTYTFVNYKYYLKHNGTTTQGTYSLSNPATACTASLYLFLDRAKRSSTFATPLAIYSVIMRDGNVIVRYLVPCYRKSDSKPGMYDIINKQFYYNGGSGDFTVGSNITTN